MRIGVGSVDYTPHASLPLMGNFRDDYLARGTHDPLYAKAIVFEDAQGTKAGVLALDICMLDRQNDFLLYNAFSLRAEKEQLEHILHARE
jgi:hypothetical protein